MTHRHRARTSDNERARRRPQTLTAPAHGISGDAAGLARLASADSAVRAQVVIHLQQTAGNAAIQRLAADQVMIQRDWWESTKEFLGLETDEEKVLSELNDGLERAKKVCEAGALVASDPAAAKRLEAAAGHFESVSSAIGTGLKIKGVARDVTRFVGAIEKLEKIPPEKMQGSEEAAKAFGQLFSSAGKLGGLLPEGPWSAYFKLLEEMSDFFVNMQRKIDPEKRWKDRFEQVEGFAPSR